MLIRMVTTAAGPQFPGWVVRAGENAVVDDALGEELCRCGYAECLDEPKKPEVKDGSDADDKPRRRRKPKPSEEAPGT